MKEPYTLFTLNDVEFTKEEEPIILQAREDLARDIRKKEEETKIKLQNEKEIENQMKLERTKPKELVNGLKFTFDCNGLPIPIKPYNLEKLTSDFYQNKYIQVNKD